MTTRLKKLREKTGYKIEDIVEKTGIPTSTYIQLEKRPIRKTSIHIYLKLAEFYGVGLDYLLGLNTTPTFDIDIVNYQTIKETQRIKELNFNETEDEENIMLQTVDTKVLHKIINKKAIEFKEYPFNFIRDVYGLLRFTVEEFEKCLTPTIVEDLEVIFDTYLTEQEKYIVNLRYVRGFTYNKIGKLLNLSQERIRQITNKSLRKIRSRHLLNNFVYNIDKDIEQKRLELEKLKAEIEDYDKKLKERLTDKTKESKKEEDDFEICELNLTNRSYNALFKARLMKVNKVLEHTLSSRILKVRNLGKVSYFDILKALKEANLITYDETLTEIEDVAKTIREIPKVQLSISEEK